MNTIDLKTNKVVYLPLELSEITKTIGNFEKKKNLLIANIIVQH